MQNVFSRVPTFAVGEQKRERASRRDERRWGRKSKSCQFKCWYYRCSTVLMQWSQSPSYKASFRLLLKYVVINNDTQRKIVPDMSTRCLKPGEGGRCPGWTPPGFIWRSSRLDRVSSFGPPFSFSSTKPYHHAKPHPALLFFELSSGNSVTCHSRLSPSSADVQRWAISVSNTPAQVAVEIEKRSIWKKSSQSYLWTTCLMKYRF